MSDNPIAEESQVNIRGAAISFRGILALLLIFTLCVLTLLNPELYSKSFESIAIAVVAFYFGQSKR